MSPRCRGAGGGGDGAQRQDRRQADGEHGGRDLVLAGRTPDASDRLPQPCWHVRVLGVDSDIAGTGPFSRSGPDADQASRSVGAMAGGSRPPRRGAVHGTGRGGGGPASGSRTVARSPGAGVLQPHGPAVCAGRGPDDGQAEAGPADVVVAARPRAVQRREPLERALGVAGGDPRAVVGHGDQDRSIDRSRRHGDLVPGVPDRVVDQVDQHPPQRLAVARDGARLRRGRGHRHPGLPVAAGRAGRQRRQVHRAARIRSQAARYRSWAVQVGPRVAGAGSRAPRSAPRARPPRSSSRARASRSSASRDSRIVSASTSRAVCSHSWLPG